MELARMLESLDFVPVILRDLADSGRTISDKLEAELADIGFAFVLLSPDDVGGPRESTQTQPRARQNVIFEHGLLVGRLGAKRVCAIVKSGVELPSDLSGVLYKALPSGMPLTAIAIDLIRELKIAGYEVDANRMWAAAG
jgi:predicted nucleotide-binding protein